MTTSTGLITSTTSWRPLDLTSTSLTMTTTSQRPSDLTTSQYEFDYEYDFLEIFRFDYEYDVLETFIDLTTSTSLITSTTS